MKALLTITNRQIKRLIINVLNTIINNIQCHNYLFEVKKLKAN